MIAGDWNGRSVAIKLYKPEAVRRHQRRHGLSLSRFEHDRNLAFFQAPGLRPHVAEPLGWIDEAGVVALVQERLTGSLYYFRCKANGDRRDPEVIGQLERIVAAAHAAGLFDVDLHALNVMVEESPDGRPVARLFDFNLVPFHERPRNPLTWLLLRTGVLDPRARDLRKLRRFHDFARIERRLLPFYG